MKPRVLALLAILLLIGCVLLFWKRGTLIPKNPDDDGAPPTTRVTSPPAKVRPAENQLSKAPAQSPTNDSFQSFPIERPVTPEASNTFYQRRLEWWQVPIDFLGKVLDESSNAVAGASVQFRWIEIPEEGGERTAATESDSEGLFSLRGKRGGSLRVLVSKQGYYTSRRTPSIFDYAITKFSPDPLNPIIFHLRKKGRPEALIAIEFPGLGRIEQLRRDGTPAEIDLLQGKRVPAGSGHVKLEFWRDAVEQGKTRHDWKFRLSVPGGGLVETDEEFNYEAPEHGYEPSIQVDMLASREGWESELRRQFFLQLANGKYGRMELYLLAWNGVFTIQSSVNPSGSRNLEPAD